LPSFPLGPQLLFNAVPLPRNFLNDDEEILVELRPHWVFFARPLFTAVAVLAAVITLLVAVPSIPNWLADALLILAAIPALWLAGRLLRWAKYLLVLTSTRIVVRRGVLGRITVQIRLQRITGISLSQKLWERVVSTGRLIIEVQGEDDAVVLQFVRKPAIVQRVINGQINALMGCGEPEPIPAALRHIGARSRRYEADEDGDANTPPFGVPVVRTEGAAGSRPPSSAPPAQQAPPAPRSAPFPLTVPSPSPAPARGTGASEIRDRLIELDDLRQRRIISEEEFAAKKAELLSRI
jgi:membrane protein YdbS with pleckstrin-like domain